MGRKTGGTIEAYEKDQKALELRKEGHTYESISEQLGYSTPSASYKAVMLRELEVQRLDAMLYAVWDDVLQGDANAVNTALRISERRSRLLRPWCSSQHGGQDKDRSTLLAHGPNCLWRCIGEGRPNLLA